jgi:hypothetical protein
VLEEREAFVPVHAVAVSSRLLEEGGPDLSLGETEDELGLLGAFEPTEVLS